MTSLCDAVGHVLRGVRSAAAAAGRSGAAAGHAT
jgi:hypothetical protein